MPEKRKGKNNIKNGIYSNNNIFRLCFVNTTFWCTFMDHITLYKCFSNVATRLIVCGHIRKPVTPYRSPEDPILINLTMVLVFHLSHFTTVSQFRIGQYSTECSHKSVWFEKKLPQITIQRILNVRACGLQGYPPTAKKNCIPQMIIQYSVNNTSIYFFIKQ